MRIQDTKQWLVWADKAAPTSALNGSRVNWQNNLSTYAEAAQFCSDNPAYNLGFCFSPDTPFVGLDLDGCRNPATSDTTAWSDDILADLPLNGCFVNVSVSGTGVKVILKCSEELRRAVRHYENVESYGDHTPQVELFVKSKYFAITAKELPDMDMSEVSRDVLSSMLDTDLTPIERTEVATGGDVAIERIEAALSMLDIMEFESRDRWFAMLQGVHHGCGGSDEGYAVFREWSAGDEAQFNEEQLQLDWDSQDASIVGGITFGTVLHQLTPEQIASLHDNDPSEDFSPVAVAEEGVVGVLADFLDPTNRNHTEVAYRFVSERGANFRYVSKMKEWLVWSGVRWEFDKEGTVVKRELSNWTRSLADRVPNNPDAQQAVATARTYLANLGNNGQLTAILEVMKTVADVTVAPESLDSHVNLFNCLNGTLNLDSGLLQEHDRDDLITKCSGTNFVVDQDCPNWLQTVERIFGGDQDLIKYVQRLSGYALCGEVSEEKFPVLYGSGCNGKSTFTQTLGKLFGEYTAHMPSEILNTKKDLHPTYIIELKGARLALMAELESNVSLAESTVKKICSQDALEGRRMHRDPINFRPSHLIMLPTNHKPDVRNQDNGIWRRVCLIPFNVNLESVKDVNMPKKLESEMGGILSWLLEGYQSYKNDGLGSCKAIEDATSEYREDEDTFKMHFDECFEPSDNEYVAKQVCYAEYLATQGRLGKQNFYREMKRMGCEEKRVKINGATQRAFTGIKLRQDRGTL